MSRNVMTAFSPDFSRLRRRALLAGAAFSLAGCSFPAHTDFNDDGAPQPLNESAPKVPKAPWALVLGSGGPRGFTHVGVLKALAEIGVKPPMIVGASVGSLVGAVWSAGMPMPELERLALSLSPVQVVRLAIGGAERFSGAAIAGLVNHHVDQRPLEKLNCRLVPVAVRKSDRMLAGFDRGDAGVAVQASCAIEGIFSPVRIRGEEYIDPDLVAPLPVRFALRCCAHKTLSVDVSAYENKAPERAVRYREGDLRKRALTAPDAAASTLHLHPEFSYFVSASEEFRRHAMQAGYAHTIAHAKAIAAFAASV